MNIEFLWVIVYAMVLVPALKITLKVTVMLFNVGSKRLYRWMYREVVGTDAPVRGAAGG